MANEEINSADTVQDDGFVQQLITEAVTSPLNLLLLTICCVLIYKIYRASRADSSVPSSANTPSIPRMKRQDLTLEQLRQYDGKGEHSRVCVAVNGKVFDMTRGSRFYGPGGPYAAFAGHDATHALATFNMDDIQNESSDLSDLTPAQMESVREWEMQFTEKYDYVGRLLKPGDVPTEYSDDDESKDAGQRQRSSSALGPSSANLSSIDEDTKKQN